MAFKNLTRIIIFCLLILSMASSAFAAVVILAKNGTRYDLAGLSTDVKPTSLAGAAIHYGSTFYAENTGIRYVFGGSGWVVDTRPFQYPGVSDGK